MLYLCIANNLQWLPSSDSLSRYDFITVNRIGVKVMLLILFVEQATLAATLVPPSSGMGYFSITWDMRFFGRKMLISCVASSLLSLECSDLEATLYY